MTSILENARTDDCYQCAKFHSCITVHNFPEILSFAAGLSLITLAIPEHISFPTFLLVL